MNSPGLQAGDQKAHISPSPLAALRAARGEGNKGGVVFLSPGLKAGAIHECNIVELLIIHYLMELQYLCDNLIEFMSNRRFSLQDRYAELSDHLKRWQW